MKKNTLAILTGTALALGGTGCASTSHYTFLPSEKVIVEKVRFRNRFRIEVAGDLYIRKTSTAPGSMPRSSSAIRSEA